MNDWLQKANGWKRIWFLLTCSGVILSVLPVPLYFNFADYNNSVRKMGNATIKELQFSECSDYATKPLETLTEPRVNESCYYVYLHREYRPDKYDLPLTEQKVWVEMQTEIWTENLFAMVLFLVGTIVCSLILYSFGVLVAWIRVGFKKDINHK